MRRKRRRRKQKNIWLWFRKLSRKKQILICISIAFVIILLAGVLFLASKFRNLQKNDVIEEEIHINDLADDVGEGFTNIALFGVDARGGVNEKGARTDCIIIASLNNETKEVKLVSVYRDTLLDITNGSILKCNSAYSRGGEQQAISMLNMNLDLNITDYVTVDWSAVIDSIDLLGGLDIEIEPEEIQGLNACIQETAIVTGNKANYINTAGLHHLDGVQATSYCRLRSTAGSDYRRTERQRYVIEKMFEKALESNLKTINSIVDKVFPKIKTSLTLTEILSYAKHINKYTFGENAGFPFEKGSGTIPGKGSSVYPITLKSNVSELHKFLFGTEDYQPTDKVIEISNEIAYIVANRNQNTTTNEQQNNDTTNNSTSTENNNSNQGDEGLNEGNSPTDGENEDNIQNGNPDEGNQENNNQGGDDSQENNGQGDGAQEDGGENGGDQENGSQDDNNTGGGEQSGNGPVNENQNSDNKSDAEQGEDSN